jgi:hypothetical protein
VNRQAVQEALAVDPAAVFGELSGRPVDPQTAVLAKTLLELPGDRPIGPLAALQLAEQMQATVPQPGPRPRSTSEQLRQRSDRLRKVGAQAEKLVQRGEIGPDEGVQRTLIAVSRGWIDPAQPIEAQMAALTPDQSAELALRARSLTQLQQLSREETNLAAESLGAGRTIGGRRNSHRKDRGYPGEASVLRTPGNVLSAGMEFGQDNALLPILVAPKNQQIWAAGGGREAPYADASGPEMQIAQYYAGKDAAGRSTFAPSLRDARVLYVNPYAELSDALVERLGLEPVPIPYEKDVTGAYDQDALNVPIPDTGQAANTLPPKFDPSYTSGAAPVYRNPTVAEAVRNIALQYSTPIKSYTADMLVNRGADYEDRLVDQPDTPVYALGSKRVGPRPAPIAAYFEQPVDPMTGKVSDAPLSASVRVGSGQRYAPEFYEAFDELVDVLAAEAYGRGPTQLELATDRRFSPALASSVPGETRYGALMNLRSVNPLAATYQRRLLEEAGFPIATEAANPFMGVVDLLDQLAGAPPSDVPLTTAVRTAAQAEPIVAPRGQTGAARLLARAKQQAIRSGGGVDAPAVYTPAATEATTVDSRRNSERAMAELLGRLISSPTAPQPRAEAPFSTRQLTIPGTAAAAATTGFTPSPIDDFERAQPSSSPTAAPRPPQQVVQFVPRELYDQFWRTPGQPAPLRREAAENLRRAPDRQLGLALQLPYSATGLTPDPIDDVARYMARQAVARSSQQLAQQGSTAGGEPVLAGRPRTPDVTQGTLGLDRMAYDAALRRQVTAEQSSAWPQVAVSQTSSQSPLNAPPPSPAPVNQAQRLFPTQDEQVARLLRMRSRA